MGDLQENLAPFYHRATYAWAKGDGEAEGTDAVRATSLGAAPNHPGELADASVPGTEYQISEHKYMAAASLPPSRFVTECSLWPTLA